MLIYCIKNYMSMRFLKRFNLPVNLFFFAFFLLYNENSNAKNFAESYNDTEDGVVKILAIGNSFSQDALEHYLHGLAKAGGHKIVIGNLYIGGAELALHWTNADENKESYSYRKIGLSGEKVTRPKTAISFALADEDWDYISFQQASPQSGLYQTYVAPLPALINYVKANVKNPDTKYVLHQTWAYAQTTKHKGFVNYKSSQQKMYKAIAKTTRKASKKNKMDLLVPSGTAVQNARTSFIGDSLNVADGYHLAIMGRYAASCTWYEKLFNQSVIGNTYYPTKITQTQALVLQNAAHEAVQKPFKITVLDKFIQKP